MNFQVNNTIVKANNETQALIKYLNQKVGYDFYGEEVNEVLFTDVEEDILTHLAEAIDIEEAEENQEKVSPATVLQEAMHQLMKTTELTAEKCKAAAMKMWKEEKELLTAAAQDGTLIEELMVRV